MLVLKTGEEVKLGVVWVQDPYVDSSVDSECFGNDLLSVWGRVGLTHYPDGAQVWSFSVPRIQSCGLDLPPDSHDYSPFPESGFVA